MSVFDTSAVLAIMYKEAGADIARKHLDAASISLVNVAEVLGDLRKSGRADPAEGFDLVKELKLRTRRVHEGHVERVAELGGVRNLALGDRFCIALGEAIDEPLVTGDTAWANLPLKVPVILIR